MQKHTHARVGRMIADDLARLHGIRLDMAAFEAGCVLPDQKLRYVILHPHYFKRSFPYLCGMIRRTMRDMQKGELTMERFSLRLGLICHYIADFFCHAHNHPRYLGYGIHKRYEQSLDTSLDDTGVATILKDAKSHRAAYLIARSWTIAQWLWQIHREYRQNAPSLQNDMEYSITAQAVTLDHMASLLWDALPQAEASV